MRGAWKIVRPAEAIPKGCVTEMPVIPIHFSTFKWSIVVGKVPSGGFSGIGQDLLVSVWVDERFDHSEDFACTWGEHQASDLTVIPLHDDKGWAKRKKWCGTQSRRLNRRNATVAIDGRQISAIRRTTRSHERVTKINQYPIIGRQNVGPIGGHDPIDLRGQETPLARQDVKVILIRPNDDFAQRTPAHQTLFPTSFNVQTQGISQLPVRADVNHKRRGLLSGKSISEQERRRGASVARFRRNEPNNSRSLGDLLSYLAKATC